MALCKKEYVLAIGCTLFLSFWERMERRLSWSGIFFSSGLSLYAPDQPEGWCRLFDECWLDQSTISNQYSTTYDVTCDYSN